MKKYTVTSRGKSFINIRGGYYMDTYYAVVNYVILIIMLLLWIKIDWCLNTIGVEYFFYMDVYTKKYP